MCGVRAVVDGGAELPNVDQVAASDLHDAPCIFSANVQKNGSPASSNDDAAAPDDRGDDDDGRGRYA